MRLQRRRALFGKPEQVQGNRVWYPQEHKPCQKGQFRVVICRVREDERGADDILTRTSLNSVLFIRNIVGLAAPDRTPSVHQAGSSQCLNRLLSEANEPIIFVCYGAYCWRFVSFKSTSDNTMADRKILNNDGTYKRCTESPSLGGV